MELRLTPAQNSVHDISHQTTHPHSRIQHSEVLQIVQITSLESLRNDNGNGNDNHRGQPYRFRYRRGKFDLSISTSRAWAFT